MEAKQNFKETLEDQINKLEMKLSISCVRGTEKDKEEVMDDHLEKKRT